MCQLALYFSGSSSPPDLSHVSGGELRRVIVLSGLCRLVTVAVKLILGCRAVAEVREPVIQLAAGPVPGLGTRREGADEGQENKAVNKILSLLTATAEGNLEVPVPAFAENRLKHAAAANSPSRLSRKTADAPLVGHIVKTFPAGNGKPALRRFG
jgi:hypothetical protein